MGTQFCHAEGSPSHLFMVDKQPWAPLHPLLWKCHLTAESSSHRKGGSCSNRERGRQEEFCTEKTEPRSSKSWEQPGPRVPPSCPGISPWLHSSWQREKPHSPSGEFWESCNQSSPPLHPKLQCLMFSHFTFRAGKKEEVPSHVWVGICEMWGVWGAWGGVLDPPSPPAIQAGGKPGEKNLLRDFQCAVTMETPFPASQGCSWFGESTRAGNGAGANPVLPPRKVGRGGWRMEETSRPHHQSLPLLHHLKQLLPRVCKTSSAGKAFWGHPIISWRCCRNTWRCQSPP